MSKPLNGLLTWDDTIKVGDYVLFGSRQPDMICVVEEITRRYLTPDHKKWGRYADYNVGDEYNPSVKIKKIKNLSLSADPNKKVRATTRKVDGSYLTKVTPDTLEKQIKRLHEFLDVVV